MEWRGRQRAARVHAHDRSNDCSHEDHSRGVNDLRVSNRSSDRAHELARLVGGRAIPFDEWPTQCREIGILITSTSSETTLLRPENLGLMLRDRLDRPLFIIDIAVPRDVDPSVMKWKAFIFTTSILCNRWQINRLRSDASKSPRRRKSSPNMSGTLLLRLGV